jgi:hypothetical protein
LLTRTYPLYLVVPSLNIFAETRAISSEISVSEFLSLSLDPLPLLNAVDPLIDRLAGIVALQPLPLLPLPVLRLSLSVGGLLLLFHRCLSVLVVEGPHFLDELLAQVVEHLELVLGKVLQLLDHFHVLDVRGQVRRHVNDDVHGQQVRATLCQEVK